MKPSLILCLAVVLITGTAASAEEAPAASGGDGIWVSIESTGEQMNADIEKPYRMHVLSHTHWDREWYQPFQAYRRRLVYIIDALMDLIEARPSFRCFHLDGQTSVIDDYLEVRPQNRERLARHIRSGRIVIGPWYTMPDEGLLSGEAMVRNLLAGCRMCEEYGAKPLPNGFVSDIFFHVSQFPQIVASFGLDSVYLYRGTPCVDEKSEMVWEGADGTEVLLIKSYPEVGYQDFMEYRDSSIEEVLAYEAEKISLATTRVLYGMDGNDHQPAKWDTPEAVARMNSIMKHTVAVHSTWADYLADLKKELGSDWTRGRIRFTGELRLPAKGYTWTGTSFGTGSSRLPLKQANDRAETLLERTAEPLHAWAVLRGAVEHKDFLDLGWKHLFLNQPHDSISGCSVDQAHRDMVYRFDQAIMIADNSIDESIQDIASGIDTSALSRDDWLVTVFNPGTAATGPVTDMYFDVPSVLNAEKAAAGLIPALADEENNPVEFEVLGIERNRRADPFLYKTVSATPALRPRWDLIDRYHVAAAASVPPLGYRAWRVTFTPGKQAGKRAAGSVKPVKVDSRGALENEFVKLVVNDNGTVDLYDKATRTWYKGIHVLEDCGDTGNGWNHEYPTEDTVVLSTDSKSRGRVKVEVAHEGRLSASIKVSFALKVPEDAVFEKTPEGKPVSKRARKTVALPVETTFTLEAGSRRVDCRTRIDNTARRHRVCAIFPSSRRTDVWYADSAFDMVRRDVKLPDTTGWKQHAREEYVFKNFAAVCDEKSGLAVITKGLNEAAVRDRAGRPLALTLFRGFSQTLNAETTYDSLLLGPLEMKYAIAPFTPEEAEPPITLFGESDRFKMPLYSYTQPSPEVAAYKSAREFSIPSAVDPADSPELSAIMAARPKRERDMPWSGTFMEIGAPLCLSTVKLSEDSKATIVRVWNPSTERVASYLRPSFEFARAWRTDSLEKPIEEIAAGRDGRLKVSLRAKELMTIRIER